MHKFKTVLFDMDGTIVDSSRGIKNGLKYTFEKMGLRQLSDNEITKFIGPPLYYSFSNYCGLDKADTQKAVDTFREYYIPTGVNENEIYPGIKQLIIKLKSVGIKVMLCTAKPETEAIKILKQHNIYEYFDYCAGATKDESRSTKEQVMQSLISDNRNLSDALMIGDRDHDINAANKNNIKSMGVLWGFGSKEELQCANATYIAATVEDAEKIIFD